MKTHNAIVFEGGLTEGVQHIREHIQTVHKIPLLGNPDFEIREHKTFTIADARSLKERANQAPLSDIQVFVITAETFLREAQNALLKLLEEPSHHTYFYILLPSVRDLLPTVRSRLAYGGTVSETHTYTEHAQKYLHASKKEQLALLEPIIKKKDRGEARKFLQALEAVTHTNGVQKNASLLQEIYFVRTYLTDRSSSLKMLLEHLVVST